MSCPERQRILARFREAFDEYSVTVREQRAVLATGPDPGQHLHSRSEQARTDCERLWTELQQHQSKHKCWP
jgi:hypothetical protein